MRRNITKRRGSEGECHTSTTEGLQMILTREEDLIFRNVMLKYRTEASSSSIDDPSPSVVLLRTLPATCCGCFIHKDGDKPKQVAAIFYDLGIVDKNQNNYRVEITGCTKTVKGGTRSNSCEVCKKVIKAIRSRVSTEELRKKDKIEKGVIEKVRLKARAEEAEECRLIVEIQLDDKANVNRYKLENIPSFIVSFSLISFILSNVIAFIFWVIIGRSSRKFAVCNRKSVN
jgi:hypothetical protein